MSSPPNERVPSASVHLLRRRRSARVSAAFRTQGHYIPHNYEETISDSHRRETSSMAVEPTANPSTVDNISASGETGMTTTDSNILTAGLNSEDDCAICRDRKVNQSYLIPCMHTYCYECILRWVRINPTCPLCKANALKIIHSINSDTDFGEYEIRRQSHGLPVRVRPSDIHIHSNSPHMFFTFAPEIFATQMAPMPVQISRPIDLSTHISPIDPRIEALLAITLRSLRSPMSSDLLRRLMYTNRMCSFPTSSNTELLSIRTVVFKIQSSISRSSQWTRNLEEFCRREIAFIMPWVDYTSLRRTTQINVACKPIGAPPYCVTSRAVKNLSRRIIQHIFENPRRLNNITELASSIRQLDRYASGGDGIFDFHSVVTVKRLAWEIKQFSRYNSTVDEYYRETSLFPDEVINQVGDPVLSNALYMFTDRSGTRHVEDGFRSNLDDICRSTVKWLFRKLFGSIRAPYIPPATLNSLRPTRDISMSLRNPASDNPRLILRFSQHADENQSNGIRGLLSLMVSQLHEPTLIQPTLCELIDLARIFGACNRATTVDRALLSRRIANLIRTYSQPIVELGTIPDVTLTTAEQSGMDFSESNQSVSPSDGSQDANQSETPSGWIVLSDSDDDSDDADSDAVEVLETVDDASRSTLPTILSRTENSMIPPCCHAHKRHCCCCRKRSSDTISSLFQEFLDYYVQRKKRRRAQQIELNTPNSPIVISDDDGDNVPEGSQPMPGPSTRPSEVSSETFRLLSIVQKTDGDPDVPRPPTPVLERPETADEFYALLNDAMSCDKHESHGFRGEANFSSTQPQSRTSGTPAGNGDYPARPTSAPNPLSHWTP